MDASALDAHPSHLHHLLGRRGVIHDITRGVVGHVVHIARYIQRINNFAKVTEQAAQPQPT